MPYNQLNKSNQKVDQLLFELENKENEVASLNSLLDKYSLDLRTIENKFTYATKEKESLCDLMNREKDYNEKNKTELNQVTGENIKHKKEIEKLNKKEKNLQNDLSQTEEDNKNLRQMKIPIEEHLNELQLENDKLREENRRLNDEVRNHHETKANLQKNEFSYNNEITKLKNDLSSLISVSNENINALNYFLENYFGNLYSPNVQLPDININGTWNEQLRFDLLRKNILNMKNKYDTNCSNYLSQLKEMKNALTKGQDDNFKYQKCLEDIYQLTLNEIEEGKYFKPKKDQFNINQNLQELLPDLLKQLFSHMRKLKLNSDEDYLSQLSDVNNDLKNALEKNQTKNEEIAADAYILEKKVKYLLQEIELKNAHLKSLEEMLNRRNDIEENNKKLVRDNVMLINKIKKYQKTGNIEALYNNDERSNHSHHSHSRHSHQHSMYDQKYENYKDQEE